MEIRQLKYFISIIDCGSLSKAAEQLYIAQPSLSLQIMALEKEFKTQLLLRSSHGVTPTEAGKLLYQRAQLLLRQVERIPQEIKQGSGSESGKVLIGLPTTIAKILAFPLFNRICSNFPAIRLQIFESESGYLAELLANVRLDMAVLFRDAETRGVSVHPLFDEDLYVFGHVGLRLESAMDVCPMQHLNGIPMVLNRSSQSLRLLIERSFARAGLELNVVADIDSLSTVILIAQKGLACTILPWYVLNEAEVERPTFRRLVEPGIQRPIGLCRPKSLPPNPASRAVYQTIIELVREFVQDKQLMGMRLRTLDSTAY